MYIFEIGTKDGFLMPYSIYSKKKKFSSLRDNERSSIFIALPKFYATHRYYELLSKSLVPNEHIML
jgi:hypothetical protein